jgi:hypothetical protein
MPAPGFPLGEDGRTIKGSYTQGGGGQTIVSEWDFSAKREE